ncbi:MAG: IscS subfamily cysteine desulfurase [Phycisphaeraceae bacterium]|nr:IscS subfamily cysteine desulfurase [Phycisphaerales bacterium]MCB9844221.1 IscS subfamily cysteine desulfurase [Phycisphaeraceae bacterium]
MLKLPVYLDHAATTPCDPRVVEAMLPYFTEKFGNPGSRNHQFGWESEEAVETARERCAAIIGAQPKEVVFTSGSTEGNNLAIKGAAEMYALKPEGQEGRGHIITSAIEHKAVLDPCKRLQKRGFDVTYLEPPRDGIVTAEMVKAAMRDDTILVTIMWANNEMGTINEVPQIGALCHERNVVFHTDATQWVGKMPTDVEKDNIDLLTWSSHKIYGPKGVGGLYIRRRKPRIRLVAQQEGGGQERGYRSGTLNVTGIVGFGKACEICANEMDTERERLRALRDHLESSMIKNVEHVHINGRPERRLAHITNMSFGFVEGEGLMMAIKDIAVSSGSACTSASLEPSYVLKGIGVGDDLAHSSLRFSLGRWSTKEQIDFAIEKLTWAVNHLRELSPLWDMHKEGIDISTIEWAHH